MQAHLQSRLSSMVLLRQHRAARQEPLMTDSLTSLSDLLEISRDGVDFFEQASQCVDDKRLRALFSQLAKTKASLAENLSEEVTAKPGRKGKASGPVAEFQKTYASLSTSLRKADVTQIDQLEQTEDRLHSRFQELVMDRDQTFVVRVLAKQYLARVDPLHREIRARKRSLS
ncbi:MAG: hypothetical protein CVV12_01040 [Gammaproteobacteria bacterium HGW-Gammaproteobacteria-2]|jgi:uncharacterized protein (TIGR02284 family)|nr:MAG: hypothetical protein CVV12_01040 [Gammaproteobacteria bacterium HGW-Gammaproteobacteria-2]